MIRAARPEDADRIAEIWESGWRDGHLGNVPDELVRVRTSESFRTRADALVPDTRVEEVDGVIAGFATVKGDEIDQMYVDAAFRGSGIAGKLLADARERIAAAGHSSAWLAVVAGNARARRFYEREGWVDGGDFTYFTDSERGPVPVPCRRYIFQFETAVGD